MIQTRAARRLLGPLIALLLTCGCAHVEQLISFGAGAKSTFAGFVLSDPETAHNQSCEGYLSDDERFAPPAGVPVPDDASWLAPAPVAGAHVYLGWVETYGGRLAKLLTALTAEGRARGLAVTSTPQGTDVAHVGFRGSASVDITLQPLCRDHLAVRYVVRSLALDVPPLAPGCAGRPLAVAPLSPEASLLPFPEGSTPLQTGTLGSFDVYTASYRAGGQSPQLLADGLVQALEGSGYAATVLSARPGTRQATSALVGRRAGVLQVASACDGQVLVRYLLTRQIQRSSVTAPACPAPSGAGPASAAVPVRLRLPVGRVEAEDLAPGAQVRTVISTTSSVEASVVKERAALARAGTDYVDVRSPAGAVSTAIDVTRGAVQPGAVPALVTGRPFCADTVALLVVTAEP